MGVLKLWTPGQIRNLLGPWVEASTMGFTLDLYGSLGLLQKTQTYVTMKTDTAWTMR